MCFNSQFCEHHFDTFLTVQVVPQDDDNKCGILTSDVDMDRGEGFVCGQPIGLHRDFLDNRLYWWSLSSQAALVLVTPAVCSDPDNPVCFRWPRILNLSFLNCLGQFHRSKFSFQRTNIGYVVLDLSCFYFFKIFFTFSLCNMNFYFHWAFHFALYCFLLFCYPWISSCIMFRPNALLICARWNSSL